MDGNYFRYTNQACPICNEKFQENDEIVVCPLCGTPHHKGCYKKNGECGNYDRHQDGFRWAPQVEAAPQSETPIVPQPSPVYESYSSAEASSTAFFGETPNPFSFFPKEIAEGVTTEEAADFTQLHSIKYIQNFFYEKSGRKTFNWAAFFFAPYWFFYRKLTRLGLVFLALSLVINVGLSLPGPVVRLQEEAFAFTEKYQSMDTDDFTDKAANNLMNEYKSIFAENKLGTAIMVIQAVLSFGLKLFAGFKANKWYYDHMVKKINSIHSETEDIGQQKLLIFKEGGMSMSRAIIAVLGIEAISMLISMII